MSTAPAPRPRRAAAGPDSPRAGAVATRIRRAWRALYGEQRLAAVAAIGLIGSMFLPWYAQTVVTGAGRKVEDSLIAFQVWSFVEASILLVAVAVLALVFARGERRAFHLPFGDGIVLLTGGAWVMFLVFFRQLDKPNVSEPGAASVSMGVSWGIFVAFAFGALLASAGWRMHSLRRPEPAIDGDDPRTAGMEGDAASVVSVPDPDAARAHGLAPDEAPTAVRRRGGRPGGAEPRGEGPTRAAGGDRPTAAVPADERPTRAARIEDRPTAPVPPDERPTRRLPRGGGRARRTDDPPGDQLSFEDPVDP